MLEFTTISNRLYSVQYSANMNGAWNTVTPPVTGNGDKIQWVDTGAPKTASTAPDHGRAPSRFYRVILLPP